MQFNLPTTKTEMYTILNDLFYYYRIRKPSYDDLLLKELTLDKMEFVPLSADDLQDKAVCMVADEHEREIFTKEAELNAQISVLNEKISVATAAAEESVQKVIAMYDESQEKLAQKTLNTSMENSSIYLDRFTYLENEKNTKIERIYAELDQKIEDYDAQITAYNESLENVRDYYANVHQMDVNAKVVELKDAQDALEREVFKYNNSIEEKLQKYSNDILKTNASLKLKYLELNVDEYTKDQLVDMGYYEDVINCVCGYYDTLEKVAAYQEISSDKKIAVYLDDYYQNIVYMYGVRSGLIG